MSGYMHYGNKVKCSLYIGVNVTKILLSLTIALGAVCLISIF